MTWKPKGMKNLLATAALAGLAACTPNELGRLSATKTGDMTHGNAPRTMFDAEPLSSCGPGGRTPAGDEQIHRSPYLQQVTDTSAHLLWTSIDEDDPVVTVTELDGSVVDDVKARIDESAELSEGAQYVAVLEGLEPYRAYCYEIEGRRGTLIARTGFRTAPEATADSTVRFTAFGDTGQRTGDQLAVAEQLRTVQMDFAILSGDVGYKSGLLSEFEYYYFDVYADIIEHVPFFPATGNHDYRTADAGPFRQAFALPENGGSAGRELYYSFDYGSVHVVALDTEQVGQTQRDWLAADLAANDLPWTIVVGHRPPYSSGYHGSNSRVQDYFVPVFEEYGVDLGIFGHDHSYERTEPINDVTYIVTGGGGVGTRPIGASSWTAFSEQVSHFVYFEANPSSLTVWAIDATGNTFDTLQLTRSN